MVITEEELRQAWQNGRGRIPAFPPGTRFTPAALDFLKVRDPGVLQACAPAPAPATGGERRVLQAPKGQRLIFTAADVAELTAGGAGILVVHPSVTVTHAALELLRKAGVRVIPHVEPAGGAPEVPAPVTPAAVPATDDETLRKVKQAVLARLDRPVDPAVLDAVLRRVLAAI
jgi:hypothetical protein